MKKLIRTIYVLVLTLCSTALVACELSLDSVKSGFNSTVDSVLGFLGLQEEEEVISAEDAIKVLLVEQEAYVSGDFTVTGSLFYKGTSYPLSWASDNACLSVSENVNENGNYTISVTRPELEKQTATLTATLVVGETTATKSFTFSLYPIDVYEISDAYTFKYANKTVKESFAIDAEYTYEGKTATIAWEVPAEYAEIISIENGKVVFEEVSAETPVSITGIFTYNNQVAKRPFNFTLIPATVGPTIVSEFADGDSFKFGLYQEGLGAYLYFAGATANKDYYLATTEKGNEGTDVTVHVVEGGYHLSFVNAEGATKYLDMTVSGTYVNAAIVDAPVNVWTFNTEYNTFVQAHEVEGETIEYYFGAYNTYNTISASKISYAKDSYPSHLYILPYGPVVSPVAGVAYKYALYQEGLGKTLYFNGQPNGYYLGSTENLAEAVDVVMEEVEGGYHLSFVNADGVKLYLELVIGTKVNAGIVETPTRVWTYNKEYYTFTQKITAEESSEDLAGTYYMGTYNTYTTISASLIKYAGNSYPAHMYAEGSDFPKPVEMSFAEAKAAEDGTLVIVTGTVKSIDTPWDSGYGNMSVTIEDEEGNTLYVYRLKTLVAVGDKIVINGKVASHNGEKQIGQGGTAEIITGGEPQPGPTHEHEACPTCGKCVKEDCPEEKCAGHAVDPNPNPAPVANLGLTVDTLGLASQSYTAGTVTVNGVALEWIQLGNYGNGIQMRDKDGNTSILWNTSATGAKIVRIELVYSSTKDVQYANANAVIFSFGNAVDNLTYTTKLSTTAGVKTYSITTDGGDYTFFKMEHDLGFSMYWDSITIVVEGGNSEPQPEPTHQHELCAECGKCVKADCPNEKCAGHEVAPAPTPVVVTTPVADVEYYLGMVTTAKGQVYFTGAMNGYYGASSQNASDAVKVVLVAVNGGYNVKFDLNGATKYINAEVSGTHKNFVFRDNAATVWTWNTDLNALVTDLEGTTVYIGTYGTYFTFGLSDISNASTSYVAQLYTTGSTEQPTPTPDPEPTHEHELCDECGKCVKEDCPEEKCAGHEVEPNPNPVVSGGKADLETMAYTGPNSSEHGGVGQYVSLTSTNGWVSNNAALLVGGTTDSNPVFQFIGADYNTKAVTINGKTAAKGTLTSPTLTGGISKLTFNYGHAFSDKNGVNITVTITEVATGKVVELNLVKTAAEVVQKTAYVAEFVLDTPIVGEFTIVFSNNSPSNSATSNKDRVSLWTIAWEGAE